MSVRATARASNPAKARSPERRGAPKRPLRASPFAAGEALLRPTLEKIHAAPVSNPIARPRANAPPRGFVRKPVMQELEGRLLLSADLNPAAPDTLLAVPALQGAEFRALVEPGSLPVIASMQVAPVLRTNELVFVDTATPEYQALIDDMRESAADQGRRLEFVLIDAERDGIRKITDTLAQKSDLDAIHIISHATDGAVQLGSSRLDFETLTQRAASIKKWGNALVESGDLLIYGCDLAASADGKALVDALARLTRADVAASEDLTGAAALGGDWKLEFTSGRVETRVAVSAIQQERWNSVLASEQLDWGTVSWPAGSLSNTYTVGSGDVAIAISGDTGRFLGGYPVDNNSFNTGGLSPAQDSLHLNVNFTNNAQQITITIDFTHPGGASNVSFTLFDIDNGTGTPRSFIDQVAAFATVGGVGGNDPTSITLVGGGTTSLADTDGDTVNDAARGNGTTNNAGSTSNAGNATFTFGQSGITRITLIYNNVSGVAADPANQAISLHDISFTANRAPVLANGSTLNYSENAAAAAINTALTVADVDSATLASATVSITGNFASGQDVLGFVNGPGMGNIAGSYDAGTGVLTLTSAGASANLVQWQTALRAVTYSNSSDAPSTAARTVSYVVNDGLIDSNSVTSTVNVAAVNDAPVNSVPGAQATVANVPLVFSSANGNLISVDDVDASTVQVELSVTAGTLTLSSTAGLSFAFSDADGTGTGDGTADGLMRFRGTKTAVNAALAGLSFTRASTGATTLAITTSDLGATGAGGTLTDTDTVAITVLPGTILDLNSTPPVTSSGSSTTSNLVTNGDMALVTFGVPDGWTEGGAIGNGEANNGRYRWNGSAAATLTQPLTVPPDSTVATYSSAGASLVETTTTTTNAITSIDLRYAWENSDTTGVNSTDLEITYAGTLYARFTTGGGAGATGSWTYFNGASGTAGSGIAAVGNESTGPLSQNTITLGTPVAVSDDLVFTFVGGATDDIAIDDVSVLNTATSATIVRAVDLADNDWLTSYTENGTPAAIADLDSSIFDADSPNLVSAAVTLTNPQSGDHLLVDGSSAASGTLASGIAWVRTDTAVTLSGSYTKAQYADAIELIQFENTTDNPSTTARIINVLVNDGSANSNTAVATIDVTPLNDAPVADDELGLTTAEDTLLNIDVLTGDTDVDGDALSVTQINGTAIAVGGSVALANGSVTLLANGTLDFTPALNYTGPVAFTYTVSDGTLTDTGNVTLSVTPLNDAPVADDELGLTTAEDTLLNIDVLTGDTDVDGDALSVTQINGTAIAVGGSVALANGSVTLLANGTLDFTPALNYTGPVAFTYTVSDGTLTDTGNVTLSVTPLNDAPVADDELGLTTAEDTLLNIDVLTGDTDVDGDALSVTQINGTAIAVGGSVALANGSVTLLANGTLDFTPALNYTGPVAFTYTVSDGTLTDTGNVTLSVTPLNDAPVADDELGLTTAEDTLLNIDVLTGDTDVDGDALSVTQINGTAIAVGGSVALANGSVTLLANGTLDFTPALNYTGPVAFTYTVSDGTLTDTGNVTLSVTPLNDAPVADDELGLTTAEDTLLNIDVLTGDTDVDGDALSVTQINGTAIAVGGSVALANGSVTLLANGTLDFTPALNYTGPVAFTYTVSDGTLTDTGNVTLSVTPLNDAPVADDELGLTTAEDTLLNIDVLTGDTDVDGDALSVTQINGTAIAVGGSVALANGSVTLLANGTLDFTPALNYTGPVAFTYTVSDGTLTDTGNVTLSVTPLNDAPVADDELGLTTAEDTLLNIDVLTGDTDVDGDALSVTQINGTAIAVGGSVALANGSVTLLANGTLDFTPALNYTGPVAFTYTVSDGTLTDTGNVTLSVTPLNDAPVADDELGLTTAEDTLLNIDVLTGDTDVDGDALSVTQINGTAIAVGGSVALANGSVTLLANGTLDFTPALNYTGPVAFTYTVSDGTLTDTGNVTLSVTPLNDAPVADDELGLTTAEDTLLNIDVLTGDTDVDGDALSVTQINGTAIAVGGSVALANGSVTLLANGTLDFTPALNYTGPVAFTYTVSDGTLTDTGNVTLSVTPLNDAPVADDELGLTTAEDTLLNIDVLTGDTDVDGDALSVTQINGTAIAVGGSVALANGSVTLLANGTLDFTPALNYTGPVAFTYTVSDGTLTDTGNVTLSVTPLNDAPVADDELGLTTAEDTLLNIDVLTGDTDVDGDALSVTQINGTAIAVGGSVALANGSVTLLANGTLDFTPALNYTGPVAFTYTVSDGTLTDTGNVTLSVTPLNDAPVADDELGLTTAEDTLLNIDVLTGDTDVDGDALSVTQINGTAIAVGGSVALANGSVTLLANGTLDFTPALNYTGPVAFTYTVSDGTLTDTGNVTLSVTPLNDAPVADDELGLTTAEDTLLNIDVLTGDTDVDGDALSVTQINGTAIAVGGSVALANGSVTLLANGTLDFTPALNYTGPVAFTYTVSDGTLTDTGNVTLSVTPLNDAPVADDELGLTTAEDTLLNIDVLTGDTDVDGDALSVTQINGTAIAVGGSVALANGSVTLLANGTLDFTPALNYTGPVAFTYTVSDGTLTDTGNVTLSVTPLNDAPVADDELGLTTAEDTLLNIDVLTGDTDVDGDALSVTQINGTAIAVGGSVALANGSVTLLANGTLDFTPALNYTGPVAFTYTVSDGTLTDTGNVTLSVTPLNDAPVADDELGLTTAEDTLLNIDVLTGDTDVDGDALSVTQINGTAIAVGGSVALANGSVTLLANGTLDFTPALNYTGPVAFTYTVSDGTLTDTGNVTLSVTPLNDAPVADDELGLTTAEDTLLNIDVLTGDTDVDGDALSVTQINGTAIAVGGSVALANGSVTLLANGTLDFTPALNYTGPVAFTYTVSDGTLTDTGNVTLSVTPLNDAPVADDELGLTTAEDTLLNIDVLTGDTDVDGDALSVTQINGTAIAVGGSVALANGSVTLLANGTLDFTPALNYTGPVAFTYTVSDGTLTDTGNVTLSVTPLNDAPVADDELGLTTAEDTLLNIDVLTGDTDVDGDALSVTQINGTAIAVGGSVALANGSVTLLANGTLDFTPALNYTGPVAFTYTVSDGTLTDTGNVTLSVTPLNDAPVADDELGLTTAEDTLLNIDVLTGDTDVDGDALSVTQINGTAIAVGGSVALANGSVTLLANGTLDFTPALNYTGPVAFTYTVSDGTLTDTGNVTLSVTPLNDAPVADDELGLTTAEDTLLNIDVLTGDTDVDGDALSVTQINGTAIAVGGSVALANGSVTLLANGTLDFTPALNYTGPVAFTYTVSDGTLTDTGNVTLSVTPLNDAPVADDELGLTTAEDTLLNIDVLTGDTDVDGDALSVTQINGTAIAVGGSVALANGSVTLLANGTLDFTPALNYTGPVAFTYTVSDGTLTDTGNVTLSVTPLNDAPVADDELGLTTAEDTLLNIDVLTGDTDVDGDALSVTQINGTAIAVGGSVALANGSVTLLANGTLDFTPALNYTGPVAFTYTVSDGTLTDTGNVTLSVTPLNDAPVADDELGLTTAEDTLLNIDVLTGDTDVDGDALSVTQINGTAIAVGGSVALANGSVTLLANGTLDFTPALNYTGPVAFTYTVSDGTLTDTGNVTLSVTPLNDAPVADDELGLTTAEDTLLNIDVLTGDTDVDGDALSVTQINGTAIAVGGSVALANGSVTLLANGTLDFTPALNYTGPVAFTYTVSDGTLTDTGNVTLSVTPLNDAPVADDELGLTTAEDTLLNIDVLTGDTDVDGDALSVTQINGTAIAVGGSVALANGSVTLLANGTLDFTPALNYTGPVAFTYTVSDGTLTDTGNVTLSVTPLNDAPVADDELGLTTAEDTLLNIDVLTGDTDVDGDALSVTQINGTAIAVGGSVALANGSVTLLANGTLDFTPALNYTGPVAFTYTVSDGTLTDTGNVTLSVTPLNDAPVADDELGLTTAEDTLLNIDVLTGDTDVDGDALSVTQINGTAIAVGGSVALANGSVTLLANGTLDFTPALNYTGPVAFTYTVSDGTLTDTGNVTLSVTPLNDAPVADDELGLTTAEDTLLNIDVLTGDTDVDGDALSVTQINGTAIAVGGSVALANGSVTLLANGTLDFTPALNYTGPVAFTYTVSDGTLTDTGNVTLSVTPLNDAPVADDELGLTTAEDTLLNIDVLTGDTDVDGDALSVTQINGTAIAVGGSVALANGSVTLLANGTLDFTPALNYTGPVAFTYTVSDGTLTDTGNVTLSVTPLNDAPVADDELGLTTAEDTLLNIDVLTGDTDVDGDALSVTQINGTAIAVGGSVALANGSVTLLANGTLDFTPALNYTGPVAFTYTVSDGTLTDTGNVTLSVTPLNDAPVADDELGLTTAEDTLLNIDVLTGDTDVDGDALSVTQINGTAIAVGGSVALANGSVTLLANGTLDFTPALNYTGPVAFTYTVSDGTLTDTGNVTLSVTPLNDAPVADDELGLTTAEDTLLNIDVLTGDTDVDGDALSVTQINGTAIAVGGSVALANGSVTLLANGTLDFTPALNYTGPVAFTYTVSDGTLTDTGNVTLSVTPLNDAPVADDELGLTTAEDTLLNIDVLTGDTDVDGDALSVTQINGTAIAVGGSVALANGSVTLLANGTLDFTPALNYTGPVAFTYTVSDGTLTDTGNVTLSVTPLNDAPVADDELGLTTAEDTLLNIDVLTGDTDVDGDALSVTQINGTAIAVGGSVALANGSVTLLANGTLDFTPALNYTGPVAFTYTVSDGTLTDTGNVTLSVTPLNDAPVADDELGLTTAEDTLLNIDVLTGDTDVDGDALSVTQINGTAIAVGGSVALANGSVTLLANGTLDFTPALNYTGPVAFTYTVSDGTLTDTGNVTLSVTPLNDAPVADDELGLTTAEDTLLNIDVLTGDTDVDGDALSVTQINGTAIAVGGSVALANGSVTLLANGTLDFTPALNYTGPVAFTYTVSDGTLTDTGNVTLSVTPLNDAPVAGNNSFPITDGGTLVLSGTNLSATDVDNPAGGLAFSPSNVLNGRFEFVAVPGVAIGAFTQAQILGGQVQFVHTGGGAPSFDLTVSDGTALTGPYPGNILFSGGTPPPAPGAGGSGDAAAAVAGLFETGSPPPAALSGELVFAPVSVSPLVLPAPLIGLADRFGVEFERTPAIGAGAILAGGSGAFGVAASTGETFQSAVEARIGASRDLPPIRAEGDVIETRVAAPEIAVARLRPDELQVRASEYTYACVPENVDPFATAPLRAVPGEERLEPDADDRWRLDATSGAVTITGLAAAAGALWWAARANGLVSGLLAAAPTWRHLDPMPALGRDGKDDGKSRARSGE